MTVETALDRAGFILDFGVPVTWTRAGVVQPSFLAIFSRPTSVIAGLSETDLIDRHPTLTLVAADLPAGAAEDDPVSVVDEFGIHTFRCKTVRPDGSGFVIVDLKS